MSASNSSTPPPSGKSSKPSSDYPLFAQASGQWAKKVRGKIRYRATSDRKTTGKPAERLGEGALQTNGVGGVEGRWRDAFFQSLQRGPGEAAALRRLAAAFGS